MDQALAGLLTLPVLVLCVIISLIVKLFRSIVEWLAKKVAYIFPDKWEPWWVWAWREKILPAAPLAVGGSIGYFVEQYPYPEPFDKDVMARVFLGIVAGLVTAFLYPRFMAYYKKFGPKKVDEEVEKIVGKETE